MGHGRRVYLSAERIDIGPQRSIYLSHIVHGSGTVRVKGLLKRFPGRKGHRRAVPTPLMNPPWTRGVA